MNEPTFKHKSWEDYSFWQTAYYYVVDGEYRSTLQNAITEAFKSARADLDRLFGVEQQNPLATRLVEWRDSLKAYGRDITCDEAANVKVALERLAAAIRLQWESDERDLKAGKKQRKQPAVVVKPTQTPPVKAAKPSKQEVEDTTPVDSDDSLEALVNSSFGQSGHTTSTAQHRVSPVKPKGTPPPTPEQIWQWAQNEMEDDCSETIAFGEHDVAGSVLYKLGIHGGTGTQERPSKCEVTNNETRIIFVGKRVFWTVGLSHAKRRKADTFLAYERTGKRSFTYVSGKRHARDPAA